MINIIDFYFRYLQQSHKENHGTVGFLSSKCYTRLTKLERGAKTGDTINYSAVEKWTKKNDIFQHEFLVISVNESLH